MTTRKGLPHHGFVVCHVLIIIQSGRNVGLYAQSKQGQIRVAWHGFDCSVKDGLPRIESRQFVHRIPRFLSEHEFSHSEESFGHGAVWIFLPGGIHGKRHGFGLICFRGLTVQSPPRGERCFVSLGLYV